LPTETRTLCRSSLIGRLTSLEPKPRRIVATTVLEYEPLLEVAKYMGADAIVRKPVPKETLLETMGPLFPKSEEALRVGWTAP
jgi:hypothetical protein